MGRGRCAARPPRLGRLLIAGALGVVLGRRRPGHVVDLGGVGEHDLDAPPAGALAQRLEVGLRVRAGEPEAACVGGERDDAQAAGEVGGDERVEGRIARVAAKAGEGAAGGERELKRARGGHSPSSTSMTARPCSKARRYTSRAPGTPASAARKDASASGSANGPASTTTLPRQGAAGAWVPVAASMTRAAAAPARSSRSCVRA